MSGFDRAQFDADLDDIENYLGYLQGNLNAWETFHAHELSTVNEVPWPAEFNYKTPCSDGRFAVDWNHYPSVNVKIAEGESDLVQQRAEELKQAMDEAYNWGVAWAGGSAGQLRQICEQFTEPYVPTLRGAIESMQSRVVNKLDISANDEWANLGDQTQLWTGLAAGNFKDFYANYNDVIARFGTFAGWVNIIMASGTNIIAVCQLGAGEFVSSMKKNLESQLSHWADNGGDKPTDPSEWPAWVGDVAGVVEGVLGFASDVPVVNEVVKFIDTTKNVWQLMGDIDKLLGGDGLAKAEEYEAVMTATEAWDLLSTTLYDKHYKQYVDGMDALNSGGGGGAAGEAGLSGSSLLDNMQTTKQRRDWSLPDVKPVNMA